MKFHVSPPPAPKKTAYDDIITAFLLSSLCKAYLFIVLHRGKAQVNYSFVLKHEMIISDRLTQTERPGSHLLNLAGCFGAVWGRWGS